MASSAIDTVSLSALTLVGLPVSGGWQDLPKIVPGAWHLLFAQQDAIAQAAHTVGAYVGVSLGMEDGIYLEFVGRIVSGCKTPPAGLKLLHVPANSYRHGHHTGPLKAIAATFQAIYDDAEEFGIPTGEFKLDFGYQADGAIKPHDLYIGIDPIAAPKIL